MRLGGRFRSFVEREQTYVPPSVAAGTENDPQPEAHALVESEAKDVEDVPLAFGKQRLPHHADIVSGSEHVIAPAQVGHHSDRPSDFDGRYPRSIQPMRSL